MSSSKIFKALTFAYEKHNNQYRKSSNVPYIVHPFEVMTILFTEREKDPCIDDDLIIAGLLHDVNEDSNVSFEEIELLFGKTVRNYVFNVSEPEHLRKKKNSWKERKSHTINYIKNLDKKSKYLICADKLANLNSILNDLIIYEGDEIIWKKFSSSKSEINWYYSSCIKELNEIKESFMYKKICYVYFMVFKEEIC